MCKRLRHHHDQRSPLCFGCRLALRRAAGQVLQNFILALVGNGRNPKQIAGLLGISLKTVQYHFERLKARTGLREWALLLRWGQRRGFVSI